MNHVYLTALTNDTYLPGVMALAQSLQSVKAKYALAIMIPAEKESFLRTALEEYGVLDIPGTFLLPKENICLPEIDTIVEAKYSYWRDTFFKIQAAGCTEFEKIILLDCDQMLVKNIDHLFDLPAYTSTTCGRCVHPDWLSLSSGLLVLQPSEKLHAHLLSLIVPAVEFKQSKGQQAGDQDVFNLAFPEWRHHPELYLPEKYNICWGWIGDLCEKEKISPKAFYMVHFPGLKKPWDFSRHYYLKIFVSCVRHGNWNKLIYKTYIWRKYRVLCEKKARHH